MPNPRTIFTLSAALVLGLLLAYAGQPILQRQWAMRDLFSSDDTRRAKARQYFLLLDADLQIPRLRAGESDATRIVEALQGYIQLRDAEGNRVFQDVVSLLEETEYWMPEFIPPSLYFHRIEVLLDLDTDATIGRALDALDHYPQEMADTSMVEVTIPALYRRMLVNPRIGPSFRNKAFLTAVRWLTPSGADRAGLLATAIHDADHPQLRRAGWIVIGLTDPITGYSADWEAEPDRGVVEAILWATTVTNPDHIGALAGAVSSTPWKTNILPWLLAQSPSDDALAQLRGLQMDGNPAALIPLLERVGDSGEVAPNESVRAFLGIGAAADFLDDAVLYRWYLWRRAEADSFSLNEFREVVSNPVAADGSVWAAVLLAERLLSAADAGQLASNYLRSLEEGDQRAGLLLSGLLQQHAAEVKQLRITTTQAVIKRAARLAELMLKRAEEIDKLDLLFAERLLQEDHDAGALVNLDTLVALLTIQDETALERLFEPSTRPGRQLLRNAWLIERFFPADYQKVAPLHPWGDSVAQLQLEIIGISQAISPSLPLTSN